MNGRRALQVTFSGWGSDVPRARTVRIRLLQLKRQEISPIVTITVYTPIRSHLNYLPFDTRLDFIAIFWNSKTAAEIDIFLPPVAAAD